MTIEIIIACCAAVYAAANTLFRKEVRSARSIALGREITTNSSHKVLKDFLGAGNNRSVARRYFYEASVIKLLFFLTLALATLILLSLLVITGLAELGPEGFSVSEIPKRVLYFSVVLSAVASYGCGLLAARGD